MVDSLHTDYMPENTFEVFQQLKSQAFISRFTLVGGTALAIQIKHRLSEDLDFISDEEEIDTNLIKRNISKIFPDYRIIRQDHNLQLDLLIGSIKVTFFSAGAVAIPFKVLNYSFTEGKINIAPAKIIAVLKFSAIAQRNTFRDYYDLYCLSKYHYSLLELISFTKEMVPNLSPVTYTETLVYTNDIEEDDISAHLSPSEDVTKEQIASFFSQELVKIKEQI
ncbi:MAG: nucleotidyl transferase AbiEii/AbiGii toxin family protein [Bacteroidales bacterium]|nr:nucleotidyl transferase AbiEii/AbiGii toxin family protein [Bacteroidales bacterium]